MSFLIAIVPRLLQGMSITVQLIVFSIPIGLVIGVAVALGRVYGGVVLSPLAWGYQLLFRGTPLLLQLFVIYYGLPHCGLVLSPFVSAITAFSLCSGAYHSEYLRGAILSIQGGQMEAARALGMGKIQAIRSIILPQMLRRALPGCSNEIVYLIKYSSLAYIVTLVDLTGQGRLIAYETFRFFEVFLIVGLIYLGMVTIADRFLHAVEKKVHIPGL
jgi:polar amino acid transport system permease protein